MKEPENMEVSERGMLLSRFTERKISMDTVEFLIQGFHEGMTDEERDFHAAGINKIIDESKTEEEMITKARNAGIIPEE